MSALGVLSCDTLVFTGFNLLKHGFIYYLMCSEWTFKRVAHFYKISRVVGASLSELHASVTALCTCVYLSMLVWTDHLL